MFGSWKERAAGGRFLMKPSATVSSSHYCCYKPQFVYVCVQGRGMRVDLWKDTVPDLRLFTTACLVPCNKALAHDMSNYANGWLSHLPATTVSINVFYRYYHMLPDLYHSISSKRGDMKLKSYEDNYKRDPDN